MKKILIIDGNNLMYRCYWAIRGLSTSKGYNTSAFYGFIKSLVGIMGEYRVSNIIVVFDGGGKTWRHTLADKYVKSGDIQSGYKQRKYDAAYEEIKKNMFPQFKDIEEFLENSSIPVFKIKEVEADDIIGNLCELLKKRYNVVILSGDRDYYQLLDENVSMLIPKKAREGGVEYKRYSAKSFTKEYGIKPKRWIDVGALMGDGSDNIIGVRGIGPKRAISIVKQCGAILPLLKAGNAPECSTELVKKVLDSKTIVRLAYTLKKIKRDGFVDRSEFNRKMKDSGVFHFSKVRQILKRLEIQDFSTGRFLYYLNRRTGNVNV